MASNSYTPDVEKRGSAPQHSQQQPTDPQPLREKDVPRNIHTITTGHPFAGRLGGVGAFVVDPNDQTGAEVLKNEPDAAPGMDLKSQFDLRPFRTIALWKAASIECIGALLLVYLTIWANLSPATIPVAPDPRYGSFDNAAFIGPTVGGISNFALLTLFTFAFGIVSGAHLNPAITMATFFARLCSFPRAVLYISFQTLGATLAGLLVRASYDSRDFKVGGCWLFTDVVAVRDAFVVEFIASTALFFLAFGVGLDPRQQKVIPPALSPFLVGITLGTLSWTTGYSRYGFGGASLNPARCFGVFVGSHFPGWHWYHWVAPLCAAVLHAIFYLSTPPGKAAY